LDSVIEEGKMIRNYLANKIPMKELTQQQWRTYNESNTCYICEKEIKAEDIKVRDHDHLTGMQSFLLF